MSKKAYIFNLDAMDPEKDPAIHSNRFRIVIKDGDVRVDDQTFSNHSMAFVFLESSGITERYVCDPRHFNPDTI